MKLQKLLSLTRQAIDAYGMIKENDKIATQESLAERTVLHFFMHCPICETSIHINLIL